MTHTKESWLAKWSHTFRPIMVGEYVHSHTKTQWECPDCSHSWEAEPNNISRGCGCPQCNGGTHTKESFLSKYPDVRPVMIGEYTTAREGTQWQCPDCNHRWQSRTDNVIRGSGCPSCAHGGFDITKPGFLYYLKINGGQAYKIGITNRSIEERFNLDMDKIEILWMRRFDLGYLARRKEQWLIDRYSRFRYYRKLLSGSGNYELFDRDVLGYDNSLRS